MAEAASRVPADSVSRGSGSGGGTAHVDVEEMKRKWEEETRAAVEENERQLADMKRSYEELLHSQMSQSNRSMAGSEAGSTSDLKRLEQLKHSNPYLSNLNFDEQLSGKIVYIISPGMNVIGKGTECDVVLYGPKIADKHASIYRKDNGVVLLDLESEDARVLLNGDPVHNKVTLNHNDR